MLKRRNVLIVSNLVLLLILISGFAIINKSELARIIQSETSSLANKNQVNPKVIILSVEFVKRPSKVEIEKAALRYNKAFAYSFNVADGLIDAYTVAFPLLKGGHITDNNNDYSGYYYSDGCGNTIPFSASLSWYSVNAKGNDIHLKTPSYVTWDELKIMYRAGWNVLNHSYSHATSPNTDFKYEITKNKEYVKSKTGIIMTHFVPPSGNQGYVDAAFACGNASVTGNTKDYRGYPDGYRVDPPLEITKFKVYKKLLCDANQDTSNIMKSIDHVANLSIKGEHYWWNDFTHHVGFKHSGASLFFPLFHYYMETVAKRYGIKGADNMWMAGEQDVYEYLQVRDKTAMKYSVSSHLLTIELDISAVPEGLNTHALTLIVNTDQDFTKVHSKDVNSLTFHGKGNIKLINLKW